MTAFCLEKRAQTVGASLLAKAMDLAPNNEMDEGVTGFVYTAPHRRTLVRQPGETP
jgi:hypothetical protein